MSVILKGRESIAIEQAAKASTTPADPVAAFAELSALRGQLKRFGRPEICFH